MSVSAPPAPLQAAWLRLLLFVALGVAVGAFLLHQIYDVDVWWQIGIGRDILARGEVSATDRYAAAALGRPYHDSHWLYQVLLAVADRAGGMVGMQGLMLAFWSATLYCVAHATCRWQPARLSPFATREFRSPWPLRLFNRRSGAGFYCHHWGLLPFALSTEPDEVFHVLVMK